MAMNTRTKRLEQVSIISLFAAASSPVMPEVIATILPGEQGCVLLVY
ncbi:hypothetical protein [Sporomusa rhizae]